MKIKCPIPQCGQENPLEAARCSSCGASLKAYGKLLLMSDDLFNRGLSLSQGGHFQQAEQCLQATVLFNPRDVEATLLLAHVQALQEDIPAAAATLARALEKGISDLRLEKTAAALQQILAGAQAGTSRLTTVTNTQLPAQMPSALQPEKLRTSIQPAKPSSSQSTGKHKRKKKHK